MELKSGEVILTLLFIVYIIIGTKTPLFIANFVNTLTGKFALLFIAILFFMFAHPMVCVVLLVVIYELINRSKQYINTSYQKGLKSLAQYPADTNLVYYPDNTLKELQMTLEQDIVKNMTTINNVSNNNNNMLAASYTPLRENTLSRYGLSE